MMGLDNISAGTWVAIGSAWVALSTVLALGLGRVLGRTNEAAMREQAALGEAQKAVRPESQFYDAWLGEPGISDDDEAERGASRANSGTRFKAVKLEDEVQGHKIRRVL